MHCEDTFLIQNKLGLHARAATTLAQLALSFDANIILEQDTKTKEKKSKSLVKALMLNKR